MSDGKAVGRTNSPKRKPLCFSARASSSAVRSGVRAVAMPGKTSAAKPCPVRVCPPPACSLWYNAVLLLWHSAVRRSAGASRLPPSRSMDS